MSSPFSATEVEMRTLCFPSRNLFTTSICMFCVISSNKEKCGFSRFSNQPTTIYDVTVRADNNRRSNLVCKQASKHARSRSGILIFQQMLNIHVTKKIQETRKHRYPPSLPMMVSGFKDINWLSSSIQLFSRFVAARVCTKIIPQQSSTLDE